MNVALGWKANVLPLLALDDYRNFTYWVDGDLGKTGSPSGIHGGGHGGVGGEVSVSFSRPSWDQADWS